MILGREQCGKFCYIKNNSRNTDYHSLDNIGRNIPLRHDPLVIIRKSINLKPDSPSPTFICHIPATVTTGRLILLKSFKGESEKWARRFSLIQTYGLTPLLPFRIANSGRFAHRVHIDLKTTYRATFLKFLISIGGPYLNDALLNMGDPASRNYCPG